MKTNDALGARCFRKKATGKTGPVGSRLLRLSRLAVLLALSVLLPTAAPAANTTWIGPDANWAGTPTGSYWSGGVLPGLADTIIISGSGVSTLDVNNTAGSRTVTGLVFQRAEDFTIANGTGTQPVALTVTGSITRTAAASGTHTISSTLGIGSMLWDINGSGALVVSGNISGTSAGSANSITKTGTGTLVLSGSNSYTGGTAINGGILSVENVDALGQSGTISFGGGTLQFRGGGEADYSSRFSNAPNQAYNLDFEGLVVQATGLTSSGGTLNKTGAGYLVLLGNNTYAGLTTIAQGAVFVGANGTTGSITGDVHVEQYATIAFDRSDSLAYGGDVDGDGGLIKQGGTGTLTLTGNVSVATVQITGTLAVGDGGATGSFNPSRVFDGGTNATLGFNHSNSMTTSASLYGSITVVKEGTGTLTLSGDNNYSDGTMLKAGTLALGSANAIGTSGTISFAGGTLQSSASNTTDYSSRFSNAAGQQYRLDTNGQSVTLASALTSSGGSLTKSGEGTLTLSGNNSYTGGTNVNAGTVALGSANAIGSSGTISFGGGTLRFSASNTTDYSSRFSNASNQQYNLDTNGQSVALATTLTSSGGSLTKLGDGTLTLVSAQTYSGSTTVSGGTLAVNSSLPGDATVASGARLEFNRSAAYSIVSYAGSISGAGTVTKTGDGSVIFTGSSTYSGMTTVSAGSLSIEGSSGSITGDASVASGASLTFDRSTNLTYRGNVSGNGSLIKGWGSSTLTLTGDITVANVNINRGTLAFGDGGATGSFNPGSVYADTTWISSIRTLELNHTNTLTTSSTIYGGIRVVKEGTGTLTLSGDNNYSGGTTLRAGTLALGSANAIGTSGTIAFVGGTLQFTASNTTDYSSRFSNVAGQQYRLDTHGQSVTLASSLTSPGGSLTKSGEGTLTLSGNNSYTGGTNINAGTVALVSANAIGNSGAISFDGGTLRFSASNTSDYSSRFSNTVGQQYRLDTNGQSVTLASALTSSGGSLTKSGVGTLTLTGSNTYSGLTTVSTGTLAIGGSTGSIAGNATISSGATLSFSRTTDLTHSGTISGAGSITQSGASTLTLSGDNSYTGGTTLASGTLSLGSASAIGTSGTIAFNGGTLQFTGNNTTDYSARFSNAPGQAYNLDTNGQSVTLTSTLTSSGGSLTKTGAGTLTLTGSSTYSGGTTISSGTLAIGGTSGSIAGSASVASGATLAFSRSTNLTHAGTISGAGSVTQSGPSTLTLTGNNSYSGGTTLTSGTLALGSAGAIGTTGTIDFGGGTLRFSASNTTDYSARFSNAAGQDYRFEVADSRSVTLGNGLSSAGGSLTLSGNGYLMLAGENTYSGGTTIHSSASLAIGDGGTTGSIIGDVSLQNGGWLVFNRSDDITFTGAISGTGNVWQAMGNRVTLTADNTFGGMTHVGAGTLAVGAGGTTGSIESDAWVYAGAVLAFNRSDALTYAGNISGDGAVTKEGAGTLTLTAASTYTGLTTVSVGTLAFGGTEGTLPGNALVESGANLAFVRSTDVTYAGTISGDGTVTQAGAGTLTLAGVSDYTGGTIVSAGAIEISAGDGSFGGSAEALGSGSVSIASGAEVRYWLSQGDSHTIANPFSLAGGTLHTVDGYNEFTGQVTLAAGTSTISGQYEDVVTLSGGLAGSGNVLFRQRGDTGVWSAPTFVLAAAGTNTGTVRVDGASDGGATTLQVAHVNALQGATLDLAGGDVGLVQFTAAGTNTYALGGLQGSRDLDMGADGLTVGGNGQSTTYSGSLSVASAFAKAGTGTLTLSGSNSFTGGTAINAGTLSLGSANAIGTSGTISFTGGTLQSTASNTTDYSSRFSSAANQQYKIDTNGQSVTLASALTSAGGSLTKSGEGTLTLAGNNSFTGGTTLTSGTLSLGSANAIGSTGTITFAGGTLQSSASNTTDYSSRFSAAANQQYKIDTNGRFITLASALTSSGGTLVKSGAGDLQLAGANTYSGLTTVAAGALHVGNGGTSGSITGDVSVSSGAVLAFNRSDLQSYAGSISGQGELDKFGSGTLVLTGTNTHSGGTYISSGIVQIGNGGTTGSISGNVEAFAGTQLAFNRSDAHSYAGQLSGLGSLAKQGAGTLTLTGANTYSGGTTISAGTLALGSANALGTSGTISFGGGTLQFTNANSTDYSSRFSNASNQAYNLDTNGRIVSLATGLSSAGGTLTKSGNGNLTLTGANTYSGLTTVAGGALFVGAGGTTGSIAGDIRVDSGATLAFNRSDSVTYGGAISGGGIVVKYEASTLTLTGNNSTSGFTGVYGGTLAIGNGGTSGSITGNVDTVAGATLVFNRSDAITYGGTIYGEGALVKQGAGTLTLSGYNSHSGPTTVQAGTLALAGTIAQSAVTVQAGAVLAGNGFIGSSLTIQASGTLAPGNSPGQITAGSLTLEAGSSTVMEIVGSSTAGTDYDTIVVTGSNGLAYGGALSIVFSNADPFATGTTLDLFGVSGTPSGDFASIATVGSGLYASLVFSKNADGTWYTPETSGGQFLRFSPLTGDLVVVPEPSTWVMTLTAAVLATAVVRRRRRI